MKQLDANKSLFADIKNWPVKCKLISVLLTALLIFLLGEVASRALVGEWRELISPLWMSCLLPRSILMPEIFFMPIKINEGFDLPTSATKYKGVIRALDYMFITLICIELILKLLDYLF